MTDREGKLRHTVSSHFAGSIFFTVCRLYLDMSDCKHCTLWIDAKDMSICELIRAVSEAALDRIRKEVDLGGEKYTHTACG